MGNYGKIVTGSWHDNLILAESVPHLLHWDITYLWILEKEKDIRPISWKTRIEDWRNLIVAFFTGQLEIEKKGITTPLSEYTKPYGIEAVYWVRNRSNKELVGVLSPTVLVRLLPNYQETQLYTDDSRTQCKFATLNNHSDNIYNSIFPYFLDQAIKKLELVDEAQSPYCKRLASILKREFSQQLNILTDKAFPSTKQSAFFIRQLYWETRDLKTIDGNKVSLELPIYLSDFHEDVIYNWILEKEKASCTANELERIQAWKLLMVAFITGQLEIDQERILTIKSQEIVGQLSPTVLLRPTLNYSEYARYQFSYIDKSDDNIYNDIFAHFLKLAIKEIDKVSTNYSKSLVNILKTEFKEEIAANSDKPFPYTNQTIFFIQNLQWDKPVQTTTRLQLIKDNRVMLDIVKYSSISHEDIVYLYILEKQDNSYSNIWRDRILAWRLLIVAFFESKVSIEEENKNNEITYWLTLLMCKLDGTMAEERVGLLSPITLVRPLPDYKDKERENWGITIPDNYSNSSFSFFLEKNVSAFKRSDSVYCKRFAEILEKKFGEQLRFNRLVADAVTEKVRFLNTYLVTDPGKKLSLIDLELSVHSHKSSKYIPFCRKCGKRLTYPQNYPSFKAEGDSLKLSCSSCKQENVIDLHNFFVWNQNKSKVIVWQADLPGLTFPSNPPNSKIDDSILDNTIVEFEWDTYDLRGNIDWRWLKVSFPDKQVEKIRFTNLFYKDLLVPGDFKSFTGYPIRPECFEAFDSYRIVEVGDSNVKYELRLKGTSTTFPYIFSSAIIKKEPNLAVGIFPNPKNLPDNWNWYRYFLHGENRHDFSVDVPESKHIFPFLAERTNGNSRIFSVIKALQPDLGVSYVYNETSQAKIVEESLDIGIDFGTTNTIIYSKYHNQAEEISSVQNALRPSNICSAIYWVAKTSEQPTKMPLPPVSQNVIGDFLPGKDYGKDRFDPYIIPSVIWELNNQNLKNYLVRWGNSSSLSNAVRRAGFKWDLGEDNQHVRQNYLAEILCLSLPTIFTQNKNQVPREICIGVSFPLAFSHGAQEKLRKLWADTLKNQLTDLTGLTVNAYAIDESYAAMKAYGKYNKDEVLLVADMGGATLDVALFSGDREEIYQIGSVKFAGNNFLKALCDKEQIEDIHKKEEKEWELRDLIFQGNTYKGSEAFPTLKKFFALSLEFLRTMIESYRQLNNKPEKFVKIILAGNGWRLVETFDPQAEKTGRSRAFKNFYDQLERKLAQSIKLESDLPTDSIKSSKHIVAKGALEHATDRQNPIKVDIDIQVQASKLPSGRKITFHFSETSQTIYEWYNLLGEGISIPVSLKVLRTASVYFDLSDFHKVNGEWVSFLQDEIFEKKMDEINPKAEVLYQELDRNRNIDENGPTYSLIRKGPLQIILEKQWSSWLGKGKK